MIFRKKPIASYLTIKKSDWSPINVTELKEYMEGYRQEFNVKFQDFEMQGPMFSFLIIPDRYNLNSNHFNLSNCFVCRKSSYEGFSPVSRVL